MQSREYTLAVPTGDPNLGEQKSVLPTETVKLIILATTYSPISAHNASSVNTHCLKK